MGGIPAGGMKAPGQPAASLSRCFSRCLCLLDRESPDLSLGEDLESDLPDLLDFFPRDEPDEDRDLELARPRVFALLRFLSWCFFRGLFRRPRGREPRLPSTV